LTRYALILLLVFSMGGCSNMLFYPMKQHVLDPATRGITYEDIHVKTGDNQLLHGWLLPPQGPVKGTVLFLHGNGENISTHIGAVYWLPTEGYRVVLIDYRGYGKSQGNATLDHAMTDIEVSIKYVMDKYAMGAPVIILGQSLGASMSVYAVANSPYKDRVAGLILVSAFSDYHQIVQETLAKSWLTWLFQVPLSWTISDEYSPINYIQAITPVPVYILHGTDDQIISPEHANRLFALALSPKKQYWIEAGHNDLVFKNDYHEILTKILQEVTASYHPDQLQKTP